MKRTRITSYMFVLVVLCLLSRSVSPMVANARAATARGVSALAHGVSPSTRPTKNVGGTFIEYPIPFAGSGASGITSGTDGNLWFTESIADQIGRINPTGYITEYVIPSAGSGPAGITVGPYGYLWFAEHDVNMIGKINPSTGYITEYAIPTASSSPTGITAGPDGNLWFTESTGNQIGIITPAGAITEYAIPTANSGPAGITVGPDGNLWFTEQAGNKIGVINTSGQILHEYLVPTASSGPAGITNGPGGLDGNRGGNLWFTETSGNKIGRISPRGTIKEYPVPSASSSPVGITSSPAGDVWFTERTANNIGDIDSRGKIKEYGVPTFNSGPNGITAGPDGNLWFTEVNANQIGRDSRNMTYHGGPIMAGQMNAYVIFWEPSGNVDPQYNALLARYYTDLSSSNGQMFYNILAQYPGKNGTSASAVLAGTWTDTKNAYPRRNLTPNDILAEVERAIKANGWQAGPANYFPVYTTDAAGTSVQQACAWHSYSAGTIFAHIVYPSVEPRCALLQPSPNNCKPCDKAISSSAHEQFEAANDPDAQKGWYYNDTAGEIADLCNTIFANQNWNGHPYIIQEMWDNRTERCVQTGRGSSGFTATAAVASNDVWAVGYASNNYILQTLTEHWNGKSWLIIPSPSVGSYNYLSGVAAIANNDVWAVGYYQNGGNSVFQMLTEHWNGTEWSVVPIPNAGPNNNILKGVAAVSTTDVWAVGFYAGNNGPQTLTEHWDGAQWSIVSSPNVGLYSILDGVAVVSATDVWAVGDSYDGTYYPTLTEHWDGTQWSIVPSPSPGSLANYLNGVAVVSATDVWAVGFSWSGGSYYPTLVEHWDGSSWSVVSNPNPGQYDNVLYGVTVVSATDVWAVGEYDNGTRQTLSEHWDGSSWSVVSSPTVGSYDNYLYGVAAISKNDIWTVGYYTVNNQGVIQALTEHWDGKKWSVMPSP